MINWSGVIINWFTHGIYSRRKFRICRTQRNSVESFLRFSDAISRTVLRFVRAIGCVVLIRSNLKTAHVRYTTIGDGDDDVTWPITIFCVLLLLTLALPLSLCVRVNDVHKGQRRSVQGRRTSRLDITSVISTMGFENKMNKCNRIPWNHIDLNGDKVAIDTDRWVLSTRFQAYRTQEPRPAICCARNIFTNFHSFVVRAKARSKPTIDDDDRRQKFKPKWNIDAKMLPVISLQPTAPIHLAGDLMEERKCYFQCVRYLSLKTVKNIKVILPPRSLCVCVNRSVNFGRPHSVPPFISIRFFFYSSIDSHVRHIYGIDFFRCSIWTRWWNRKSIVRCPKRADDLHFVNQLPLAFTEFNAYDMWKWKMRHQIANMKWMGLLL